jgi:hypothetical protein
VLVYLYLRAHRHVVQGRTLIAVYAVAEGLAGALWLAGAAAPAPARYACWGGRSRGRGGRADHGNHALGRPATAL